MLIEIEPAVDSDLDEILSLVNSVVAEWFIKIIPEEYYKEPFLSKKQFGQMATFMEFFVVRNALQPSNRRLPRRCFPPFEPSPKGVPESW